MMSAEIYKLRTQRNPIAYAAALIVGVVIPPVVLIWYEPSSTAAYTNAFRVSFGMLSLLLAIEFGGWLLGTEYRQGTVKRLLTSEPRRNRALASKAIVGAGALTSVLAVGAIVGWLAARIVGSMNGVTVPWEGRDLLGDGVWALTATTLAFSISAITRSDSFAKVGTLALVLVLAPLLSSIPGVGDYTINSALDALTVWIAGDADVAATTLSTGTALITLAVWIGAFTTAAVAMFARRDV